ncbi:HNH endonuclease [Actinokineospora diospyrosa]|uniref:5-methylcytosine-specific restriction endonuclease McrA n=1 Tax=Actinokineospora diospyrosa TaxID=103728 RepID=A0ABT1IAT0_9PSEU|nr:HNH endonuclease [Actinokineospora diospyrosa]MCP2269673.1 5-methylcytosine-specific restriction endonuclease McrA [Actinokineospora diospyrosa]
MPDRQPTRSGAPSGHAPGPTLCPDPDASAPDVVASRARAAPIPIPVQLPVVPSWGRRRVLLLNTTFEPLTALSLRRAVVLVVCGKAEVVHGDPAGMVVHSATSSVVIPSVIRLSSYVRVPYRGRVPLTRAGLMHRDRYRCAYCGGRAETIDHVVPRSRGGQHTWQNCVACCARCNHRKADKMLSELGWRLRVVPTAPRGPHWRLLAGVVDADPLWLPYLGEPAA